jgi:hypothetical protein
MKYQDHIQPFNIFTVLVLLLFALGACRQPVYHISVSGSDDNPGTLKEPLKSIEKVNTLRLKPGDKILFKGGEIFPGTLSLSLDGTSAEPVVIGAYGEGKALISGGTAEAVVITGKHFVLTNIHAKGSGRKNGSTTNGISLREASNGKIENVITEGFQKSGLDLNNCQQITVDNVLARNNGFAGIHVSGTARTQSKNIRITNSKAENNAGDPTRLDNHSGNGILVGMSDSVLIEHCVATNNGWDMPRLGNGPVGIWAYESSNVTIQYCISYGNKTSKGGKDGGGFDLDGGITNSVIQYCLSYDNEGAGYGLFQYAGASLWYNNTVRYCISINDATTTEGSGGIFMWNGSEDSVQLADCDVHNNLIYTVSAPAVQFEPASPNKNFQFYNNIFIGKGEVINGPSSGERFTSNIWWNVPGSNITFRGHADLASWAKVTGQELVVGVLKGRQVDPSLKGPVTINLTDPHQLQSLLQFTLKEGSPLKNSGLNVEGLKLPAARYDFYGTPLPQGSAPEPGIFEWRENQ